MSRQQSQTAEASTADREILISRVFDAPRELVFKAWTDVRHISEWWGPNGFTTTTSNMDLRPGGDWRFVMHGPDGRDYNNRVRFLEVAEPERLVYEHGDYDDSEVEPLNMHVTVNFDEQDGKTELTLRMRFITVEERDRVVREYGAVEGGQQTLERLAEHIEYLQQRRALLTVETPSDRELVFERTYNAPRALVWEAWTRPEHVAQWYGCDQCRGMDAKLDLRAGGDWRIVMRLADGNEFPLHGTYREVLPTERLVFTEVFEAWPDNEAVITLTLADEPHGRTRLKLHSLYGTPEMRALAAERGVIVGRSHSLEKLDDVLGARLAGDLHISYPRPSVMRIERTFDAPRELVWQALTHQGLVEQWYGCDHTTGAKAQIDARLGGTWRIVMNTDDGQIFTKSGEILELTVPERIVQTDRCEEFPGSEAVETLTLTQEGARTRMVSEVIYDQVETVAKLREMGMETGIAQTFQRLARLLSEMQGGAMSIEGEFVHVRTFDAPLQRVWSAYTELEQIRQWMGPKGMPIGHCTLDARVGGKFHYQMCGPNGFEMWGLWVFREFVPQQRYSVILTFSDPAGGVTRAPFPGEWPLESLVTSTFVERDGRTTLITAWIPYHANAQELETFVQNHDSMSHGTNGTMDQLAAFLARN